MVNNFIEKHHPITLSDLLDEWEEEARVIEDKINNICGTDVTEIGSKKYLKSHVCKFCGKTFQKSTALGGHISKMHSTRNQTISQKKGIKDLKDHSKTSRTRKM